MSSTRDDHVFETHEPIELYVENGKGVVELATHDLTETRVELVGPDAGDVLVEHDGRRISILAPKHRGGFLSGGERRLEITVALPVGSDVVARLGSSDLRATGTLGNTQVRAGSGDISLETIGGACLVETGSGDVVIVHTEQPLRIKSGSGDVQLGTSAAEVSISTGSGDVHIRESGGATSVKTGSGDLVIGEALSNIGLTTGSGDLEIKSVSAGRVQVKGASGDVHVGVPAGIPVFTDVSTVSGRIHSTLEGAGKPEPGADFVELRATTVSGDIVLTQL